MAQKFTIFGASPLATTLCQVFRLLDFSCCCHSASVLDSKSADFESRFKKHLMQSSTVIVIGNQCTSSYQMISYIHYLRTHLLWQGKFLALVDNNQRKLEIESLHLFGDKQNRFRYGEFDWGHAVISKPVFFASVLHILNRVEPIYCHQWRANLSQSLLYKVAQLIEQLEQELEIEFNEKTQIKIQGILNKLQQIDWLNVLLDPHKDIKVINSLISRYPSDTLLSEGEAQTAIQQMRSIVFLKTSYSYIKEVT